MSLREKLHERAQPLLEPGEVVQQAFLAQAGPNPSLAILTWLVMFFTEYRIVVTTDRAVVVLLAGRMTPSKPQSVLLRLPRSTVLGPVSRALWSPIALPGKRTWVHRRFYADVRAADAAAAAPPPSPSGT
ncbi:MAG: hypothetical protein ACYDB7_15280 [Mycobacteriales bacterium]